METVNGSAAVRFDTIPAELIGRNQWVGWIKDPKKGKVPVQVDGTPAKADDPNTWSDFDTVAGVYRANPDRWGGIGYVFASDDPYCGGDLDACIDPITGELTNWAAEILSRIPTYAEYSPSGVGLKFIAHCGDFIFPESINCGKVFKKLKPAPNTPEGKNPEVQLFRRGKFFTFTGDVRDGHAEIVEVGKGIDWLVRKYWPDSFKASTSGGSGLDGVHEAALIAMRRATHSQTDGGDGSKRLFTCCCRAVEHDLIDKQAIATIHAYASDKPFPRVWSDAEIQQRLRDAERFVERGSAIEISNGKLVEFVDDEGETRTATVPLSICEARDLVSSVTKGWPRRMGKALFVDDKRHGVAWLEKVDAVFGWMHNFGVVDWHDRKRRFVSRSEFVAELRRTATSYEAVELLPHEPPIANIYYRGSAPPAGNGHHLRKLLDFFRPETTIDRDLIEAAFLTPFWGGPAGLRPAFVVTSKDGRGAGKSKLAEAISFLAGGFIDVSTGEDIGTLKQRFLSPEGLTKRVAIIDNVKSLKFSWAELEALITTPIVSGKALYIGELQRPNLITWFMTLNGVSLATDLAQRSVIINVVKGPNDGTWYERLIGYITENRDAIIGDIVGRLRSESYPLAKYTRWAAWEKDVLSRLPEPNEAQRVIIERQGEADCELDEAGIVEDFFAQQIARCNHDPNGGQFRLPVGLVATWYGWATNERAKTAAVSKRLKQLSEEGAIKRLSPDSCRTHGRCFIWTGPSADVVGTPINNWFTFSSNYTAYRKDGGDRDE